MQIALAIPSYIPPEDGNLFAETCKHENIYLIFINNLVHMLVDLIYDKMHDTHHIKCTVESTHLCLSCSLSVSGSLMAVLHLLMFSLTVTRSKCSYASSEMSFLVLGRNGNIWCPQPSFEGNCDRDL
jgi:hypothetical protein